MPSPPIETVAELVRRNMARLTPTERRPAQVLLASYPIAGLESVTQFARRANVSAPTVLRLLAKLGFSGYADFQSRLRDEVEARLRNPINKHDAKGGAAAEQQDDFLGRFAESIASNIHESFRTVDRGEFEQVVALLADTKRRIYLLGGRFSDAVAHYMFMHLHALRPAVTHVSGQTSTWSEYLLDIRQGDVVIAFDVRRYQPDIVEFASEASKAGAKVVLFTDQWISPISRVARHMFPVRIDIGTTWDSSAATLSLAEALLEATGERIWPDVQKRIGRLEGLRRSQIRADT